MIDVKDAFTKLKMFLDDQSLKAIAIRDYDDKYGFFVNTSESDEPVLVGGIIFVMKENGRVIESDDLEDKSYRTTPWIPIPTSMVNRN